MRLFVPLMLAVAVIAPATASAQTFSGDVSINSQYVDRDLFVLTDVPVVQASLNAKISDGCQLEAWGTQAFSKEMGGELDLGGSCSFDLGSLKATVSAKQLLLHDSGDITELTVTLTKGPVDLTVGRYIWENQDATRIELGYTIEPVKKVTLRPAVVYETGFDAPDIVVGSLDLSYALNDKLSLTASVLTPLHKGADDERKTLFSFSITQSF
jgi:hypothetical protein